MSDLRQTPFHRALHRPNLILGGERGPMIAVIAGSAGLVVSSMNLVALVAGVFICTFCVFALRRAAKKDTLMFKVYGRQRSYRPYYPPFSRPWRVAKKERREY